MDARLLCRGFIGAAICFYLSGCNWWLPNPTVTSKTETILNPQPTSYTIEKDPKTVELIYKAFLSAKETQLESCQDEKEDSVLALIRCDNELNWYKETYDSPYDEDTTPVSYQKWY